MFVVYSSLALRRPAAGARRRARSLGIETLEDRRLFDGQPLAAAVSPDWFQDFTAPGALRHAGAAGWSASAAEGGDFAVAGESDLYDWIVQFNAASLASIRSAADTATLLAGGGIEFETLRGLGLAGQVLVRSSGAAADAVGAWLQGNVHVASFEIDVVRQLTATPNDPNFANTWGLENTGQTGGLADCDIDAAAAWNLSTGSRSVVVGVIDTGVDYTHPDLAANVWTNPGEVAGNGIDDDGNGFVDDVHGYDFVNNDGDPMDDNGHGTHVSGTIAAVGNDGRGVAGVNWTGSIMALKFLAGNGSGYSSDAVRAINYATMMRTRYGVNVRVTNNSWGGGGASAAVADAIAASGEAGILFVAAAGNSGRDNDATPNWPSNYDAANLLAVAATDSRDALASFSNYGATTVDLAAPGVSIYSTVPGGRYASYSGTSMATPHVAGVAALAWAMAPTASVADVRGAILQGADRVSTLAGKVATGGRLNAFNTLQVLAVPGPRAPMIASLVASPSPVAVGASLTLTASGVVDPDGAAASVSFYYDANANGQWDASDRLLGTDATVVNGAASITAATTSFAPGQRFVFAVATDDSGRTSEAAAASLTVLGRDDHGDNKSSATSTAVGRTVAGALDRLNDRDWFSLSVTAGRSYVFETELRGLADSILTLYGADGTTALASDDDGGPGLASRIAWTAQQSGTVYLEVRSYDPARFGDYALKLVAQNTAPTLTPVPLRWMSYAQDTLRVWIAARDPDGDRVSYTAVAFTLDPMAQKAYELDQRLGLTFTGNYMENFAGAHERYLRGNGGQWYYLLPNGELHRWTGSLASSPLVDRLTPEYYANPALLHDAQAPAMLSVQGVTLAIAGNVLTIDPPERYLGNFYVQVTASDGRASDTEVFEVRSVNAAPRWTTVPAQTISASQDSLNIPLQVADRDGDALAFTAQVQAVDPMAQRAYYWDRALGLRSAGTAYDNFAGAGEKYLLGSDNTWYYLLPNGELHRWAGSLAASPLVARLTSAYHARPELLYNAQRPTPSVLDGDVALRLNGNILTIDPRAGYVGSFQVLVTASDGRATIPQTFRVSVAAAAPVLHYAPQPRVFEQAVNALADSGELDELLPAASGIWGAERTQDVRPASRLLETSLDGIARHVVELAAGRNAESRIAPSANPAARDGFHSDQSARSRVFARVHRDADALDRRLGALAEFHPFSIALAALRPQAPMTPPPG